MRALKVLFLRIWNTARPNRRKDELRLEIEDHLEFLAAAYIERGMNPQDARLAAKRDFGGVEQTKEAYREQRGIVAVESIWRDLTFALRSLRKSPGFTAVVIASLALGIGANTAIFSFVNAILLKRLPVPEPERLVSLAIFGRGQKLTSVISLNTLDLLASRNKVFDGLAGRFPTAISVVAEDAPQWMMGELVTGQYFRTLRVTPALGRLITDEDVRDAVANPVCVLSYAVWRNQFGRDPNVIGRTILLDAHPYRILGVTEPRFHGPELQRRIDIQIPVTRVGDFMPGFAVGNGFNWKSGLSFLHAIGQLKPGLTRSQAQDGLQALYKEVNSDHDTSTVRLSDASQGFGEMRWTFGRPLSVLMGIAALVLLITCANLANLLLARASAKQKEFAIRMALGGSRWRLVRYLLIESLVLALAGGAAGATLSIWITHTLLTYLNQSKPTIRALHISPDSTVFVFCLLLSLITALVFGLAPALQTTRSELVPVLKEDRRGPAQVDRSLLRRMLIATQIALSLVVLFAAGLLARTLSGLQTVDLGFKPDKVVTMSINPAASGHSQVDTARIYDELLDRAKSLPNVIAASMAVDTPIDTSGGLTFLIEVPGYTRTSSGDLLPQFGFVSPGYFATLNQRRILGRDFTDRDLNGTQRVAIVNQRFIQHYFKDRNPIGQHFRQGGDVEIVGVVANVRDQSVRTEQEDTVYLAEKQGRSSGLQLLVRVRDNPKQAISGLLYLVRQIDPRMPVFSVHTLDAQIDASLSAEHVLHFLSGLFAALATLLAAIGLFGVVSYAVVQRTREIGIRLAVGAQRRDVASLFLRESLLIVAIGLTAGVPLALGSMRLMKGLLFGLSPADPSTLLGCLAVLSLAALLAVALPLWKSTRVDPIEALRYE